jgi:NAD(P)-dependent dehydrogenase (short-subunit alcohol dehydrogenase family)
MVATDAKVCLVTGSSRGLGKAIAMELGKHGQKVVINYVSEGSKAAADQTVSEIVAMGGDAIAVQADSTLSRRKLLRNMHFFSSLIRPFLSFFGSVTSSVKPRLDQGNVRHSCEPLRNGRRLGQQRRDYP